MRPIFQKLPMPAGTVPGQTATGAALPFNCSAVRDKTLQVAGVSASTISVEATLDGSDWVAIATGVSNGITELSGSYASIRVHVTGAGADTPVITLGGFDTRSI